MEQTVTILGARGSVPVSGAEIARYGGATTCVLFRYGERFVVLDAGTGLLSLPPEALEQAALPLLLTHAHADHLLGLPLSPCAMKKGLRLDIYAAVRGGLDVHEQIKRLMSPPLWPVGSENLPADIHFHDLPQRFDLDGITVETMEGEHPGGVSLLRLEADGKRVVLATDCTLSETLMPKLLDFARNCDLLLCDGQYSESEWPAFATFGHSTWNMAARFARDCGARRLRVVHHAPNRTDAELDDAASALRAGGADFDFAKEGECIRL